MSEGKSYFDYGFKAKNYWICEDCDKDHDNTTKTIITTDFHEFQGYEGLLRIIKELSVSRVWGLLITPTFMKSRAKHIKNQILSANILPVIVTLKWMFPRWTGIIPLFGNLHIYWQMD